MPMKLCQELWKDFLSIKSFAHSLKRYAETPAVWTIHLSHQLLPTWLQMALVSERGSAGPWLSASLCSCSPMIMNRVNNLSLYIFLQQPVSTKHNSLFGCWCGKEECAMLYIATSFTELSNWCSNLDKQ